MDLLQKHGLDRRLETLSVDDLPVLAELQDHGRWGLCQIQQIQTQDEQQQQPQQPKLLISYYPQTQDQNQKHEKWVTFDQITHIWTRDPATKSIPASQLQQQQQEELLLPPNWRALIEEQLSSTEFPFPPLYTDQQLERLYQHYIQQQQQQQPAMTKKRLNRVLERHPSSEQVLRSAYKGDATGGPMGRVVGPDIVRQYLYPDDDKYQKRRQPQLLHQLMVAAFAIASDTERGGRFKRFPCVFVATQSVKPTRQPRSSSMASESIQFLNGGWFVLDPSVRMGTEARRFVECHGGGDPHRNKNTATTTTKSTIVPATLADERIVSRLESLAMEDEEDEEQMDSSLLDMDVREVLRLSELSLTSQGAKELLIRTGRWSQNQQQPSSSSSTHRPRDFQPWSQDVLNAAKSYAQQQRRQRHDSQKMKNGADDDRTDLMSLPCVCVDAKGTSFRDDAIGVRPRAMTGRKAVPEASKWEILIHITDVSDIYTDDYEADHGHEDDSSRGVLREAAKNRGLSRYDLARGPLHLLPPSLLKAISMTTTSPDSAALKNVSNRCVTLWAYIDERNGKVLDCGMERTLISSPVALTYAGATKLLSLPPSAFDKVEHLTEQQRMAKNVAAILRVAERNLSVWAAKHRQVDEFAAKREQRLVVKEMVAAEIGKVSGQINARDDGKAGFQRTRGHRLVDSALDLYSFGLTNLLRRAKAPIPRASGSGVDRGGRVGTAPLRRYIDGMAQRQGLAVLCNYGGPPLTRHDCQEANEAMNRATDRVANASRRKQHHNSQQQQSGVRLLLLELTKQSGKMPVFPALATGRENEVVLEGVGVVARCSGVAGSLEAGKRIRVKISNVDATQNNVSVELMP